MLVYAFDPTTPIAFSTGRFPRIRRTARYLFSAALTGVAYFAAAFGLVSGVVLALKAFSLA